MNPAWLAVLVPLQLAALGGTWRLSSKLTWLTVHVQDHDDWHKDRIKYKKDVP